MSGQGARPPTHYLACGQLGLLAASCGLALASRDPAAIVLTALALACLTWFPVARRRWGARGAALLMLAMLVCSVAAVWAGTRVLIVEGR